MITIIPAIDIIDGKCVRLTQGQYATKKIYNTNPLEIARMFEDHGITRLHLVDLDGARGNSIVNIKTLEKISSLTNLIIDFGGGIKNSKELIKAFNAGANIATIGSMAVKNSKEVSKWLQLYGPEKFIIGIDTYNGQIKTTGWKENSKISVLEIIFYYTMLGQKNFMLTDISKDGKLEGIDHSYYCDLKKKFPSINIIASGGVSSIEDIDKLNAYNIDGVVIGKAIYENVIRLNDLQKYL